MQKYILTEEELDGNGYPRASSIPGRAEITDCYSKLKRNVNDRKYIWPYLHNQKPTDLIQVVDFTGLMQLIANKLYQTC